jgi:hypothetical protein
MNRPIPRLLILGVVAFVTVAATLIGIAADLGAPGPWLLAAGATAAAVAIVGLSSRGRDPTVAEALCVVLTGTTVLFAAKNEGSRDAPAARSPVQSKNQPATTYDFIVYDGEEDPDDETSFSYDEPPFAYERLEPSIAAPPAEEGEHRVGTHVAVRCRVPSGAIDLQWYRVETGNFMHGAVIKKAPHSGQPLPPLCP